MYRIQLLNTTPSHLEGEGLGSLVVSAGEGEFTGGRLVGVGGGGVNYTTLDEQAHQTGGGGGGVVCSFNVVT